MISKNFNIAHVDIINTKLKYHDLDILKSEVYPFEGDHAKTYIIDDRIIFACGLKVIKQGVAHCWVIPSIYVDKYAKRFYNEINDLLNSYAPKMGLHRIQTTVSDPFVNWIEKLGFEKECTMKQITHDKKDEYLYAKFY